MTRLITIFSIVFLATGYIADVRAAPSLALDVANDSIDISTGFNGARLFVHGVIEGEGDIDNTEVAIVIKGPVRQTVIRRKEQVLGMWMNLSHAVFDDVFSFYDLATSAAIPSLASADILRREAVGLNYLNFQANETDLDTSSVATFREALIRSKQGIGHYALSEKDVTFISDKFFKAVFSMPPSVPTGQYTIDGYLFQNGEIIDSQTITLQVAQVGLNAEIFQFAQDRAFLYGLMAICLALVLGWSAHAFLRQD